MQKTLKKIWHNEFFQGGIFITISSFISNILNYLFNTLAARALGPNGFGEITALFSYMTISSVPLMVITMILIEKVGSKSQDKFSYASAIENWFFNKLRKWWFLLAIILMLTPFISRITNLSTISSYTLLPMMILSFVSVIYGSLVQGLRLFFWFSIIGVVAVILKLLGAVFVLSGIDGLATVIFFLVLSSLLTTLGYKFAVANAIKANLLKKAAYKINKRVLSAIINPQFISVFFSILAITILNNADIIFVKKFFSPSDAGLYGSWSLLAKIVLYAISPLVAIGYIFFTAAEKTIYHEKTLYISIAALLVTATISYVGYTMFSEMIINLLFGAKFESVTPYLGQASIFGSLYTGITFINNYFIAKKDKYALILPLAIPFYIALLFLNGKSLSAVININVVFASAILGIYLIAYGQRFFYNKTHGK